MRAFSKSKTAARMFPGGCPLLYMKFYSGDFPN